MQLVIHPAAQADIDGALAWSKQHFGRRTAHRLQARMVNIGKLLLTQPGLGTPDERDARKLTLRPFPYSLIYRAHGDVITVLALAHDNRLPNFWHTRR